MQKDSAKNLIQDTLQSSFNKERFIYLTKNILNHIEDAPFVYKGNFIFDDFADSIKTLERIGKYKDPEGKLIDIIIVRLKKETTLERARTKQRNFIAKYLKGSRGGVLKDAALAAFVSPNNEDWRFSLVKMEYKFNDKGKVEEEFTPARRYSFLVGKNENSHTAQSRLLPLLLNDEVNPTLVELEETFSVERVTKEFFEKYRELFIRLKESLDDIVKKDPKIYEEFEKKNVNTVDFAKKLLGQIVFLYFLQKKGWFGVPRGKDWGEGDKKFLRTLFDKAKKENKNYFNRFLEPLFYKALRLERPKDYYDQFNCRIPFLNGGLFDPINEYDWQDTDIEIPNEIFSNNRKTKEGDTGDGILDVFDRYNFTVKEDEPLEKEVAIDPEMLGKVFENLLEVKDRKSKGTYYTPREIVHYMCQESLANYLATELKDKVKKDEIDILIKYGESVVENDSRVVNEGRETKDYSFKLPASIRKYAQLIDEKLKTIHVCDPAVGSGAFPVGMMNEIIRTRNALTAYIGKDGERTPYHFKRHAIQNCLYGVDIDPGAVEIAKLRLWLSLIVDEEDIKKIKPLPNLDYKIMQGNSLVELVSYSTTNDPQRNQIVNEMKKLKDKLFNITSPEAKKKKRNEVEALIKQLFEYDRKKQIESLKQKIQAIKSQGRLFEDKRAQKDDENKIKALEAKIQEIKNIKVPGPEDHFEWHINFSEIFQEKGGFDVVIANPPYKFLSGKGSPVQELINRGKNKEAQQLKKELDSVASRFPNSSIGCRDFYKWFIDLGSQIVGQGGVITYITPNTFITLSKYKDIRLIIFEKLSNKILIDLGFNIFEEPLVPSAVFISQKNDNRNNLINYSDLKEINRAILKSTDVYALIKENMVIVQFKDGKLLLYKHPLTEEIYSRLEFNLKQFIKISEGEHSLKNDFSQVTEESSGSVVPVINDGTIQKYLPAKIVYLPKSLCPSYNKDLHSGQRLFIRKTGDKIIAVPPEEYALAIAHQNVYVAKPLGTLNVSFFVGLLSSKLLTFLYQTGIYGQKNRTMAQFRIYALYLLPVPNLETAKTKPITDLVDKILAITKDDDYLENTAKQAKVREYEKQIDQLVYKLYGLTAEEIKIVENYGAK